MVTQARKLNESAEIKLSLGACPEQQFCRCSLSKISYITMPVLPEQLSMKTKVPCVNSAHRKGFLMCVIYPSRQWRAFQSAISSTFSHLCLLCSFKEWRHQLTHHFAPSSFKLKLKTLGLFCYQNFNDCFFFSHVCFKCCRNQVTNNLQVFPASKGNTYGTDIQFCIKAIVQLLLASEQNVFDCWMNPRDAAERSVFVQVWWIPSRLHRIEFLAGCKRLIMVFVY